MGENKEPLFLYTDGGPDCRVNLVSVQLSLIMLFLEHDFNDLIAVCTPPGHSWKNPVDRMMSILNLGLQLVGVMREEMCAGREDLYKEV